ncbi:MAG TPA: FAD-dependent oxidoreductase [Longimicrobiales bacterium]
MTATDSEIAFPRLDARAVKELERIGRVRDTTAGETLFAEGDRDICFFVVLEGSIEIVEHSSGEPIIVRLHEPGEFTGDVDTLSGRAVIVSGRVRDPGRVVALSAAELRQAVNGMPQLSEILLRAFLMRRAMLVEHGIQGIKIIGSRYSADAHHLRDFANRNAIPFTWWDVESDPQAESMLCQFRIPTEETPVVLMRDGSLMRNPTVSALGRALGLDVNVQADHLYDLVVVGAGPAGLAASVYAASEGLKVITLDAVAAGGQAGTSSSIENYLGFPAGISGRELTANALLQAQKFGAQVSVPANVSTLSIENGVRIVRLEDGTAIRTRCVLVASGVEYRRLDVEGLEQYEGVGVYYAATEMEARLCHNAEVVVVGGGNSAGQAVMYLARHARTVHIVIRGDDLGKSMSRYLVDRVQSLPNVKIHYGCSIDAMAGDCQLEKVQLKYADGGGREISTPAVFMFIGAEAHTAWLKNCALLDKKGFVLTGDDVVTAQRTANPQYNPARTPFFLETSMPGVFAAGDVRSGSVKRVASAVGEGAMAVSFVHAHLAAGTTVQS